MINVNLLDWRNRKILILNRRFAVVVSAAVLAWLLMAAIIYFLIQLQINRAKSDMAYLDQQLQSVSGTLAQIQDIQNQKDLLLTRRKTIEQLQASRPLVVSIFDNLVRAMPQGVVLTDLARKGNQIICNGNGDSNYSISLLMENVQKLPWVKSAKIGELKASSEKANNTTSKSAVTSAAPMTGQISFTLNLTIDTQKAGVEDNATTTT